MLRKTELRITRISAKWKVKKKNILFSSNKNVARNENIHLFIFYINIFLSTLFRLTREGEWWNATKKNHFLYHLITAQSLRWKKPINNFRTRDKNNNENERTYDETKPETIHLKKWNSHQKKKIENELTRKTNVLHSNEWPKLNFRNKIKTFTNKQQKNKKKIKKIKSKRTDEKLSD